MGVQAAKPEAETEVAEEEEDPQAGWSLEQKTAEALAAELINVWGPPIQTLSRAGRAFGGLEALLGGGRSGTFDLQVRDAVADRLLMLRSSVRKHRRAPLVCQDSRANQGLRP